MFEVSSFLPHFDVDCSDVALLLVAAPSWPPPPFLGCRLIDTRNHYYYDDDGSTRNDVGTETSLDGIIQPRLK